MTTSEQHFRSGDTTTLSVHDLGEGGEGIGKLSNGLTCFVPGLLPGESGEIRIQTLKKNYATGKLVARTVVSPDRVEPPCPYFVNCGGCQLMDLSLKAQADLKTRQVEEAFKRISGIADFSVKVQTIFHSPEKLSYRNKLTLPVKGSSRDAIIGFYQRGSHEAVDIRECLVGRMPHKEILRALREWIAEKRIPIYVEKLSEGLLRHIVIRSSADGKQIMVVLVAKDEISALRSAAQVFFSRDGLPSREVTSLYLNINDDKGNVILGKKNILLGGEAWIKEKVAGLSSHAGPDSFSQLNPAVAEALYLYVRDQVPAETKSLVDLYCGAGILTLLLAQKIQAAGGNAVGVEYSQISIQLAKINAQENKIDNAKFVQADAKLGFEKVLKEGAVPEVVILNPPRSGVDKELLTLVASSGATKIIYVSCKPSTLARDTGILTGLGFTLKSLQPFDMLPQTTHVETVAVLEKQI